MHKNDVNQPDFCKITALTENETKDKLTLFLPNDIQNKKVKNVEIITKSNEPHLDRIPREIYATFPKVCNLTIRSRIEEIVGGDFLNTPYRSDLVNINLSKNKLTIIKRLALSKLFALEELDLSENEIHTIESGALSDLSKLKRLNLYKNEIKELSDHTFHGASSLKGLNLGSNQIQNIGNSLYGLNSVRKIMLSYNKINDINLMKFSNLPELKELDLFEAAIHLEDHINNMDANSADSEPQLQNLEVGANNLTIEAVMQVLHMFPNLKMVNVGGNKFNFDFHILEWFKPWTIRNVRTAFVNYSQISWP